MKAKHLSLAQLAASHRMTRLNVAMTNYFWGTSEESAEGAKPLTQLEASLVFGMPSLSTFITRMRRYHRLSIVTRAVSVYDVVKRVRNLGYDIKGLDSKYLDGLTLLEYQRLPDSYDNGRRIVSETADRPANVAAFLEFASSGVFVNDINATLLFGVKHYREALNRGIRDGRVIGSKKNIDMSLLYVERATNELTNATFEFLYTEAILHSIKVSGAICTKGDPDKYKRLHEQWSTPQARQELEAELGRKLPTNNGGP